MAVVTVAISGHIFGPSGVAPTSGKVNIRLNVHGSTLDGTESVRVAGEHSVTLGAGGAFAASLVPNDAITPSGTYYLVEVVLRLPNGRNWTRTERWQLTSDDLTIDLGSVPRLDAIPGLAVGVVTPQWGGDASPATVRATGSSTLRSLADRTADVVNVKDFGAKCDGSTDDTAIVQAMLASLGPKTIVVSGPCYVSANITIPAIQPVRVEGGGGFTGPGIVNYRPWGVVGRGPPTVRRTAGTKLVDFSTYPFALVSLANATNPTATLDARGAVKVSYTGASNDQFTGVKVEGDWDVSTSSLFMLDIGFDLPCTLTAVKIYWCFDTGTTFTNFATRASLYMIGINKPARFSLPVLKSELTVTGSANWAHLRRVEIRFIRSDGLGTSNADSMYVHSLWSDVAVKSKVMFTVDDGDASIYTELFPVLQAANMRATAYLTGYNVGTASFITLQQARDLYAAGWDLGNHTYRHTTLTLRGVITRSGSTATFVCSDTADQHGLSPAGQVTITGAEQPEYNGTFTVGTTPNNYTFTFPVSGTPRTTATGLPAYPNKTDHEIQQLYQDQEEWLARNGFVRGAGHFAYPQGYFDANVLSVLQAVGVKTTRITQNYPLSSVWPTPIGLADPYHLPVAAMNQASTAATLLAIVDDVILRGGNLILIGHKFAAVPGESQQMATAELSALVAGLVTRRAAGSLDVVTVSEWYDRL